MKYSILLFSLLSIYVSAQSQVEIDTSPVDSTVVTERYVDYSDQLLLKVMSVVKSNAIEIVNTNNDQSLKLKPYGISSLGFGFNYKWLGLAIAFGLPASAEDEEIYGKTTRFDFQLNIYSKKFVIDAFAQQYNGYYIENPTELSDWNETYFPQRDSMETSNLGVGGYYIFNHKKLSYKAAYVRNAVQKKSAGSFLLGGFFNLNNAGFEPGSSTFFVPPSLPIEIADSFNINSFKSRNYGIVFGYTYTFVFFKRFFINASLLPGVGAQNTTVYSSEGKKNVTSGAGRFMSRLALGYENKHFLLGLTTFTSTGILEYKDYEIKPTTSNVRFFLAKRFNIKKKVKKTLD